MKEALTQAKVYEYGGQDWDEAMQKLNSGEEIEINTEFFDYFLEVLPPVYMGKFVETVNGKHVLASFGFAEGAEQVKAFWECAGRFFACQTKEMNRHHNKKELTHELPKLQK